MKKHGTSSVRRIPIMSSSWRSKMEDTAHARRHFTICIRPWLWIAQRTRRLPRPVRMLLSMRIPPISSTSGRRSLRHPSKSWTTLHCKSEADDIRVRISLPCCRSQNRNTSPVSLRGSDSCPYTRNESDCERTRRPTSQSWDTGCSSS